MTEFRLEIDFCIGGTGAGLEREVRRMGVGWGSGSTWLEWDRRGLFLIGIGESPATVGTKSQ